MSTILSIFDAHNARYQAAATPKERAAIAREFDAARTEAKKPPVAEKPTTAQSVESFDARMKQAKTPLDRARVLADLSAHHDAGLLIAS